MARSIIRSMFLKTGAVSLGLLLVSRLLGLIRESSLAAAFGTSGMADVAVLMLTLPDWVAGLLASGALAYVLVPTWAGQSQQRVSADQRQIAAWLLGGGAVLAVLLTVLRELAVGGLAGGLSDDLRAAAARGLVWSALALPAALLAALWGTRLHHERDFIGMYGANLVANLGLIATIGLVTWHSQLSAVAWLGGGLLASMGLRLAWLGLRQPVLAAPDLHVTQRARLPVLSVWLWAALSASLPLALPLVARSIVSQSGPGSLATFNYAWKLVELPLLLAIQLVATLALPSIAQAFAGSQRDTAVERVLALRSAFALAWTLACAAAAGLLLGAPALAQLLFGWGQMEPKALVQVAKWGAAAAWGLLPQALIAVGLTVLAVQARMKVAVAAYALALLVLLTVAALGVTDGQSLMRLLNLLFALVALIVLVALGPAVRGWMPWRAIATPTTALLLVAILHSTGWLTLLSHNMAGGLVMAGLAGAAVLGAAWVSSAGLRETARR